MYPVDDPQALRDPRKDLSYYQSGTTGLQITSTPNTTVDSDGFPAAGSRVFQWGWAPVGGARSNDVGLTPNALTSPVQIGSVTIS